MDKSKQQKFTIKPFKPNSQMDEAQAVNTLQNLLTAMQEIHNKNAGLLSFEELYRSAYNLVLHKKGEMLYEGVSNNIRARLRDIAVAVSSCPDDILLKTLNSYWADHKLIMGMIRDILMYMDRTFVAQTRKTPVYDLGLDIFKNAILRNDSVNGRVRKIILDSITHERQGELVDRPLLKNICSMLVDLGLRTKEVYIEDFEKYFLEQTTNFYKTESLMFISNNTCSDYIAKVEGRLKEEVDRVAHYLDDSTSPKLKECVERELIANHAKSLVEMERSGCVAMFNESKIDDLHRLYKLFCRVPSTLEHVQLSMQKHVENLGNDLMKDPEMNKEPISFVQKLLDIREKYDRIVCEGFEANKDFQMALKVAFESFINNDNRVAQFLSSYIDDLLRNRMREFTEEAVDMLLNKIIILFRYLHDKDIFEQYYKVHLSKRLLSGKAQSDDVERSMISKLKTECGYQFSSKLEGMFTDMRNSKTTQQKYSTYQQENKEQCVGTVDLIPTILTTGFWPAQVAPSCELPPIVKDTIAVFEKFYYSEHTGRQLTWYTNLGTADIKCSFQRSHELTVSTYQMCVLMLFNDRREISFREMVDMTKVNPAELRRHVLSLNVPKFPILKRENKSKEIDDSDVFSVNKAFKSKLYRIKIPLIVVKEAVASGSGLPEIVEEDRRHLVEAAIVRVMKARKTLEHNNLIAEVTKQLTARFRPSPQQIKKRIECLIERDYLERNKSDSTGKLYDYLA
jgi:cullin 3